MTVRMGETDTAVENAEGFKPKSSMGCESLDASFRTVGEEEDEDRRVDAALDRLLEEADALFAARDFAGAIGLYSDCIVLKPKFPTLRPAAADARRGKLLHAYASRAESRLFLHKHDDALHDADRALEFDARHFASLVCRGRALTGLERFGEAVASLELAETTAVTVAADGAGVRDALAKARVGFRQSRDGDFDLEEFLLGGCRGTAPSCSDYVGPVEIQHARESPGRGLFVTRDVEAGELLVVSNALAVACSPTAFWAETRITKANHDFLVQELATHFRTSMRKMAQICTLASGEDGDAMRIPPMEFFRTEVDWTCGDDEREDIDRGINGGYGMDAARLGAVVRVNAFDSLKCVDPIPFGDIETEWNAGVGAGIASSGVWALPSFINHSCVSNCSKMFVGNAMFVRASRDLAAGDQLTFSYCDPYEPEDFRQDSLNWWKFCCKCERCLLEQTLNTTTDEAAAAAKATPKSYLRNFLTLVDRILPSAAPLTRIFNDHRKLVESGQVGGMTRIVDAVERIVDGSMAKLDADLQNWVRAPFIEAYTADILLNMKDLPRKVEALERALDIMLAVGGGDLGAMQISSTLLRDAKRAFGDDSEEYRRVEGRVLGVCKATLGRHSREFFLALIDARFHSGNQAFG